MKYLAVGVLLASVAAAAWEDDPCKPGTHFCSRDHQSKLYCDKGHWEFDGWCPEGTVCYNPYPYVIDCIPQNGEKQAA